MIVTCHSIIMRTRSALQCDSTCAGQASQVQLALLWMHNQELALEGVVKEIEAEGGVSYVIIGLSSDEAGMRLSLDTEAALLRQQQRSRWPVERVRPLFKLQINARQI